MTAVDATSLDSAAPHLETRSYPNDLGSGRRRRPRTSRPAGSRACRCCINPTKPWDIGGDRYPLTVKATYRVAGESQPRTFSSRAAIDAQVASGIYEMGARVELCRSSASVPRSALEAHAMSAGADYAIETDGLTRRFGEFTAVDRVTLKIPKGQLYGFLGLNGAGKTTTIRMLTTLLPPSAGTARLWGHDVVTDPLAVRRLVGLVSDETSESQSTWTAREYLLYFARIRRLPDPGDQVETPARRRRPRPAVPRQAHRHLQHRHEASRGDRAGAHGPVEQRTGHPRPVARDAVGRAAAPPARVSPPAARARIHRRDQLERAGNVHCRAAREMWMTPDSSGSRSASSTWRSHSGSSSRNSTP